MPFKLERGSLSKQLRRLVRKELGAAIEALHNSSAPRIHDARKHIKKTRAIVKLLRRPLGKRYAQEDARLRDAGGSLSDLRDAEVMLQTFAALQKEFPALITPPIAGKVGRALRRDHRKAQARSKARARQTLGLLKRSRAALPRRVGEVSGFRVARRGLTRAFLRSKATLATLTSESCGDDFHAWRRRVKAHWYHVRLFASRQPSIQARARRLKALQAALGDDHNLALLGETLLEHPDGFGARTTAVVLGCIKKRQHVLRRHALASGRRLFASKPGAADAVVNRWREAQEIEKPR